MILLAGPGTGKTHQLTLRIKYLVIDRAVPPDQITVITFTKEAAKNMREKLSDPKIGLPREKHPSSIQTMHSLGHEIILSQADKIDLKKPIPLISDKLRKLVLEDASTLAGFERSHAELAEECRRKGNCEENMQLDKCKICAEYKNILKKCCALDYDEQIMLACQLLRDNSDIRQFWQQKIHHLLVDEYQDINQSQFELIQLIAEPQTQGLFVVGDDDQSIYSFRGGDPKFIKEFEAHFGKEAKLGILSKSWRCPDHILLGARKVIEKFYLKSIPKPQSTFHEGMKSNNKIILHDVPSDKYEAWLIAKLTSEKLEEGNEVKVIIPNSNYFPLLKEAFSKARIDYRFRIRPDTDGLLRFTALADWVENPNNNLNLRYLLDLAIQNHDSLVKTVVSQTPKITEKRTSASEQISRLWPRVSRQSSLYNVLSAAAESDGSESFLSTLFASLEEIRNLIYKQGGTRKAISPFFGISALLLAPGKNPNSFINEIKEWANDLFGTDSSKTTGTVNIYNMPSSKGLEADVIFVTGLSESLFPNEKLKPEKMEELSRLFFVAMTRAQKELHLFNARLRSGSITLLPDSFQLKPSRFIKAIPKDHIEVRYYQVES